MTSTDSPSGGLAGLLARLYWMIVGSALLALLTYSIAFQDGTTLSPNDLAFWVVAATMAAVRWVDVRFLAGQTTEGAPATLADWRRYVIGLAIIALGAWLAAHATAHLGLLV
jgi:hypothetical protein